MSPCAEMRFCDLLEFNVLSYLTLIICNVLHINVCQLITILMVEAVHESFCMHFMFTGARGVCS